MGSGGLTRAAAGKQVTSPLDYTDNPSYKANKGITTVFYIRAAYII